VRIIAGTLKGRRLKAPTWEGLRPTSDKLRETLFNVLAPRVVGARVLDGFAGTGALGLEALSRGADHATFIDSDRRAETLIAENLRHCGVSDGCAIMRAPIERGLDALKTDPAFAPFDIVLLDPPYAQPLENILKAAETVVAQDGVIVLEHARRREAPEATPRLVRVRQIASGDSMLSLYEVRGKGTSAQ